MPKPMHRSRSKRKTRNRVPGGKEVTHFHKRKPKRAQCASCGAPLFGVMRARATALARVSKTKKRPNRPYAGQICPQCISSRIKAAIRGS